MNGRTHFVKHLLAFIVLVCTLSALLTVSVSAEEFYLEAKDEKLYATSSGDHESLDAITDADALEAHIKKELLICADEVDISSFRIPAQQQYVDYINNVIHDDLVELFHVEGVMSSVHGGYLYKLKIKYNMTKDEFKKEYSECMTAASKLLAGIEGNDSISDVQKALLLHDRLALHCEYDYQNFLNGSVPQASFTLYGALVKRIAVCQGYAEAYLYLLSRVGIESHLCESDALGHAWNIVTVNGKNYHVDVTWDDPTEDKTGYVMHSNFLLSDAGIYASGHTADDYEKSASDTRYDDYFWADSHAAFQLIGNEIYYVDSTAKTLNRYNRNRDVLISLPDAWYASDDACYTTSFTCLDADNKYLYYNTSDSVYKYDASTGDSEVIWEPDIPENGFWYIYGFTYDENYLICDIFNSPNFKNDTKRKYQQRCYYENEDDDTISSVVIHHLPSKTVYYIGDEFVSDGLFLDVKYNDGTTDTISHDFEVTGFDSSKTGVNTLTADYKGHTVKFNVEIRKPYVSIEEGSISLEKLEGLQHDSYELKFTTAPSGCDVKWESSDITVASVSQSGVVLSKFKTGTAIIKATIVYNGIEYSDACEVRIECAHFGIKVKVEYEAVESTCVVAGHGRYVKCRLCEQVIEGSDEPLALAEHKYENNPDEKYTLTPATCREVAVYYESCSVCGEKGENTFRGTATDENNHVNVSVIPPLEPCKDKDGYTEGEKCEDCGRITKESQVIPAGTEHDYNSLVVAPSCTQQGYTVYTCKLCQHVEIGDYTEAAGHAFGYWVVVKEATVDENGEEERVCSVCDEKEIRVTDKLEPEYLIGDVNGDKRISASDARLVLRYAAGLETLGNLGVVIEVLDYNLDGRVTAADARKVLRKAAGLE